MTINPHNVTREFEKALCEYTGAKYAVAVTSCTAALMLAVAYHINRGKGSRWDWLDRDFIEIPKRTYISVPQSIIHAGGRPIFRDEDWIGEYQLRPYAIWDCARRFTSGMYVPGEFQCVSFHWSKILAIGQGGSILHDNDEADEWLRRARFDGRRAGVAPKDDQFDFVGFHCYMSPRDAAEGLSRLAVLPEHNDPLPNSDYPDLSQFEVFTR
jgi:dTDP-4-amino-4,6-dideoxygalactose transaminase